MTIKEIELYNFRIYKDSNVIDLSRTDNKNIFIISGRNGFGKTTFLMSMVWCLYGRNMQEVDDLYKKEIADQGGYSKYIVNSLNRLAKAEENYNFHVAITFTDLNIPEVPCKEVTVKRTYNLKTSSNEDVEILIDGRPNELSREVGPEIFIREFIMPIEIAKFFFFDAEKIVSLAEVNTAEQRRSLSQAYSEVLGIKKYEDLKKELESLQIKLRQDSASVAEKNQLQQLYTDVAKCENEISEHEATILELREKKSEKSKESRDIQEKLIKAGSSITVEELQALRVQEEELIQKQSEIQNQLKESFEIIPFAIAGGLFVELSNQLNNEAKFKAAQYKEDNAKEVSNKILTELLKIEKPSNLAIDFKVDRFYMDAFDKLIRKYLVSETLDLPADFKVIHEFSESEKNELQTTLSNIQLSFRESFKRINADYNEIRNQLGAIRRKIRDAEANQEDAMIIEFRKQKEELDKEIIRIDDTIDSLNREIGQYANDKTQKGKQIEVLSRKLAVSEKNKDKYTVTSRVINELRSVISNFKAQKKHSLESQILKGLDTLMHKKGFIQNVDVDIIGEDIDIILRNIRGEEIRKESLSKGEQQMYATALLRGLVEESNIQFPVFIDSPMQKFDEHHAENIVKYFYPHISDQVVIFPLVNKELTAREYDMLLPNISKTYLINNVHEDKSEFVATDTETFLQTYNTMYNNAD
ncbi:DNA sulfur modification protein DndD [Mucilaginibacter sp. KACC 22063]|uniref:DNA sulfur modification protein DndD n=1 Tax=Mucilaginibacter sp. KACC 22063 TaxID=3025666 RepID=UPI00236595DE|nr:DNA sulfur modification protein DndD [Mucilaginibacter sp. KACC 22063]WDF54887.1 DNA sulfur modification protein DndD [Mucilaginibacter sp. KACC 22063]